MYLSEAQIGERLGELQQRAGITQEQLGDALGVSQPTISKIMSGARPLTARELTVAAAALGVTPSQIVSAEKNTSVFFRTGAAGSTKTERDALDTFRSCVDDYFGLRSLAGS